VYPGAVIRTVGLVLTCAASLAACAGQAASPAAAEPVWSSAVVGPQAGNAGFVLEIRNDVSALGALAGVAVVLDGALVFRQSPWPAGPQRPLSLFTTGGRHQVCVVARYQGADDGSSGTFVVRAPRLFDLVPGVAVSARVRLQQQLQPVPYASAQYEGGIPYASATTRPDPERYDRRLDELCGDRP
jgi:hypothetical protein